MSFDAHRARQFLVSAGYNEPHIVEDYRFTFQTEDDLLKNASAELVGFATAPHTMRTACVAIADCESLDSVADVLSKLRFLTAPVAILSERGRVAMYLISKDPPLAPLVSTTFEDWPRAFASRLAELSPDVLYQAKYDRQLTFMDLDRTLLGWAEQATERTLTSLLEALLHEAASQLPPGYRGSPEAEEALIRLVFQLFAGRVLEDKRVVPLRETARQMLTEAQNLFSPNIGPSALDTPYVPPHLVDHIYAELGARFAFASLTGEMLGHAYESALVTPDLRRSRGIYYTPRSVTTYVLNRLPIEELDVGTRFLVDPCCGSGSFLLAGFERLSSLLPPDWSGPRKHQYLRARIVGLDVDAFAREIATLSLVLCDVENRNGWKVRGVDVEALSVEALGRRPTIVATNPPFGEEKSGHQRRERAADILVRLLETMAESSLMGIVLPLSFLDSRTSRPARERLLQNCDVIELDILPGAVFKSQADTAVLMLRTRERRVTIPFGAIPVTVRELRAKDFASFQTSRSFTRTYSVDPKRWSDDESRRFVVSPLVDIWDQLTNKFPPIDKVASLRNGLQLHAHDTESLADSPVPKAVPYLERLDVLRPFALLVGPGERTPRWLRYGENLRRRGDPAMFDSPKVLVNATRNPGSPWRLIAATAPAGVYFSDHFHGIRPTSSAATIHEIAAVLNSPIANAWFDAHCRSRKIVLKILRSLPFPKFTPRSRSAIEECVVVLESMARKRWRRAEGSLFDDVSTSDSTQAVRILSELDDLVYTAYEVTNEDRRQIDRIMKNEKRPG